MIRGSMRNHAAALAVFLCALPAAGRAAPPESIALVNANVVDVRAGAVIPAVTVVLRDGRIESVGKNPPPAGVKTLDIRGRHLLPGLIDAHTHISSLEAARRALESGVTTVRSSGVSGFTDVGLRELVRQGAVAGPDVLASGYHVRPRLAEEAFLDTPSLGGLMSGLRTPDDVRQAVRANLARGVDWIKVLATERAGLADTDPRKQALTEEELRAAVQEAGKVPVQAHAHGDEGARAAVRAGVRSVEHGTYLSGETLALMKEKGVYFVPTLTTVVDLVEPGGDYDIPLLRNRGRHMLPRLRRAVRDAQQAGVKIVTGADTSYGPNSLTRISHEVAAFAELGMPAAQALRSATLVAAEMLGLEGRTGALEPGLEADLIAVEGNPLQDPVALQDVLLVVSNGRVGLDRLDFAPRR
jgi:imidazolonepropionase-like amidohydrolase